MSSAFDDFTDITLEISLINGEVLKKTVTIDLLRETFEDNLFSARQEVNGIVDMCQGFRSLEYVTMTFDEVDYFFNPEHIVYAKVTGHHSWLSEED